MGEFAWMIATGSWENITRQKGGGIVSEALKLHQMILTSLQTCSRGHCAEGLKT